MKAAGPVVPAAFCVFYMITRLDKHDAMKKISLIFFALFLLAAGNSCRKKSYTCSYKYYYISEHIAFVGYDAGQLNRVVVDRYQKGTTSLIGTDTIDASGAVFRGDTAYHATSGSYSGFMDVSDGADYKIRVLSVGQTYTLALSSGAESETWEQDSHCSPGAGEARITPYAVLLGGSNYTPFAPSTNNYFIFLSR